MCVSEVLYGAPIYFLKSDDLRWGTPALSDDLGWGGEATGGAQGCGGGSLPLELLKRDINVIEK